MITTSPYSPIITLEGFRSRWSTPWAWTYATARQTWRRIDISCMSEYSSIMVVSPRAWDRRMALSERPCTRFMV